MGGPFYRGENLEPGKAEPEGRSACFSAPSRCTSPSSVARLPRQFQDVQRHLVVLTPEVGSSDPQLPTVSSSDLLPPFHLSCLRPGDHLCSQVSGSGASWRLEIFPCVSFTITPSPPPPWKLEVGGWSSLALLDRETTFSLVWIQLLLVCPGRVPELRSSPACAAGPTFLPQELSAHLLRLICQPSSGTSWLA